MSVYKIDGEKVVEEKTYPFVDSFTPLIYHHNVSEDLGLWINHNTYHEMLIVAHISDLHNDPARYDRFLSFVDENAEYIDVAVETGDLIDIPSNSAFAEMTAIDTKHTTKALKCVGNHERVYGSTSITNAQIYQKWNYTSETGKTWYYKDFSEYKVRIIVLNMYDSDTAPDKRYYSQAQLDWFVNALKSAKTSEYHVLIAIHAVDAGRTLKNDKGFFIRACQFEDPKNDPMTTPSPIEDIIDAFKKGGSLQQTYTWDDGRGEDVTVNVTFSGAGDFVGYMHGHYHQDMIGYSPKHTDQLYMGISTGCLKSTTRPNVVWEETSDLPRKEGEESEDLFNLYCIDIKNRLVKVLRVGSRMNDILEERRCAFFSY